MFLRSHSHLWDTDGCKSLGGHEEEAIIVSSAMTRVFVLKRQRVEPLTLLGFPFLSASHFIE